MGKKHRIHLSKQMREILESFDETEHEYQTLIEIIMRVKRLEKIKSAWCNLNLKSPHLNLESALLGKSVYWEICPRETKKEAKKLRNSFSRSIQRLTREGYLTRIKLTKLRQRRGYGDWRPRKPLCYRLSKVKSVGSIVGKRCNKNVTKKEVEKCQEEYTSE